MHSVCRQTPAQIFGIEPIPSDKEDRSGVVLWFGRIWMCIFKKVIIPCAAGVTSKGNPEGHTFGPNCVKKTEIGTKPSDLPIYSKECVVCREASKTTSPPSSMEETVGNIRKELWVWQDSLKGYRHKIINVYRKSFSKADSAIDHLREPANGTHRVGAIAVSGLAGYLMGLRSGKFRRIFYGAIGALGMAAVCYPDDTAEALEAVVLEGRKYFIIAYHFIYGEPPKIPEWLENIVGPIGPKEAAEPLTDQNKSYSEYVKPNEKKL